MVKAEMCLFHNVGDRHRLEVATWLMMPMSPSTGELSAAEKNQ